MPIINQPFQGQLGNILINELTSDYKTLTIFSAFAKNSGVLRLKNSFEKFKTNGGKIRAFIGIDLDGTSYEALLNLFNLCDMLYVIHSENFSTTYHSKVYLLENSQKAWCAVGSNNLTGGGLWTNFESCSIQTFSLPDEAAWLSNIYAVIAQYTASDYSCSAKITSIEDIDTLFNNNYISKEVSQKINNIAKKISQDNKRKKITLFGSEKISIPVLVDLEQSQSIFSRHKTSGLSVSLEANISTDIDLPVFSNEQFWFEMRKSTGGSRNILDLSKLGQIESGSVRGTPYEHHNPKYMYGGIKFFDIDPEDIHCEKNITINYSGKDYYPSTIKFTPGNGTWRIQLKGSPDDGSEELSRFGNRGDFIHKILVFEKISTDYYVLSLLEERELNKVKSLSRVWARNGNGATSKAYGML